VTSDLVSYLVLNSLILSYGASLGLAEGLSLGEAEGLPDGEALGLILGDTEALGESDRLADGDILSSPTKSICNNLIRNPNHQDSCR
jgi:hypothetical protein